MKLIDNESKTIKDKYLRKNNAGCRIVFFSLLILFIGMLSWLLLGSYNLTITGYADALDGIYMYVPADEVDKIDVGMTVSIGNSKGKINFIGNEYCTYDDLVAIYGRTAKYLHISPEKSYYEVISDNVIDEPGYLPYIIIYETVSPMEYFFGRN